MQNKTLLLASFVDPNKLDEFTSKLFKNYDISKKSIFFYETNADTMLLTYKINLSMGERINIRKIGDTVQIHKKGSTIFTINALKELIKRDNNLESGNIDFKEYTIDWDNYKDKAILVQKGELYLLDLKRVFFDS